MEDLIETAIFDYIKENYTEAELSSYDRSQILLGVYDSVEDYIEQFVK